MGTLVYSVLASADGYFEDSEGRFDWAQPNDELHRYINQTEKLASCQLLGRKMYQIMKIWENFPGLETMPDYIIDYATLWQGLHKVVYSTTLQHVETAKTTLKSTLDYQELTTLKQSETGLIGIGGADLASQILQLKLVDEIHLYIFPVLIGSGKKWIQTSQMIHLDLYETREFSGGVVLNKYHVSYQ